MKRYKLLLLLCGFAALCASCSGWGIVTNDIDRNIRGYHLFLSFLDAEGNDLVKGIGSTEPEGSIEQNYVSPDEYMLTSSPDRYDLGWGPRPGYIPDNPNRYPTLRLSIPAKEPLGKYMVSCAMTANVERDNMSEITYTLICPYIFGDDAEH